ncbi:MAG: hypothetical protein KIS83_09530 [Rubrivivax sp.]|nr:hypothetical protein [Rubrivivax sp.]
MAFDVVAAAFGLRDRGQTDHRRHVARVELQRGLEVPAGRGEVAAELGLDAGAVFTAGRRLRCPGGAAEGLAVGVERGGEGGARHRGAGGQHQGGGAQGSRQFHRHRQAAAEGGM